MTAQAKRRSLIALCGLPVLVLASRSFYFQELFFAFLLFAMAFAVLLLMAGLAVGMWVLYARGLVYLATRTANQGRRAMPMVRAMVLWVAPTVTRTAGAASAVQQVLLYPFGSRVRGWLNSLQLDASQFREEAERAVKHLRLLLKQS